MVTALKRFTIDRAPRVLTLCLKCFDFSGKKISKVCTQLEGNSLSLPGAGDFPKQDALSQAVQVELLVFPFWGEESSCGKASTCSAATELLWPRTVSCHPRRYLLLQGQEVLMSPRDVF